MKAIITYSILLIMLVGCATQKAYKGESKNIDEISIISPSSFRIGHPPLAIREVDGIKLDKLKSGAFEVLPGEHAVVVSIPLNLYQWTPPIKITFNTEKGKKYIVDYKGGKEEWIYFVREDDSKKIIYQTEQ